MKKVLGLAFCFIILGCRQEENKKMKNPETKKFDMYEMSEMAILMEQIYVNNSQLKKRIIEKSHLGIFPNHFLDIHTAVMTEKQENDLFFKENAKLYIDLQQQIYDNPANAKQYFNQSIDVCIKCHQEKCTGPIPRIKKLYIQN